MAVYVRVRPKSRVRIMLALGRLALSGAISLFVVGSEAQAAEPAGGAIEPKVASGLQKRVTIVQERNNLEMFAEDLSDEIDVPIKILFRDLQLEGITKCASASFDYRNETVDVILRKCLKKENRDGKMIYVVRKLEPEEHQSILITTRAAALDRGDKIPPGFIHAPTALQKRIRFKSDGNNLSVNLLLISDAIDVPIEVAWDDVGPARSASDEPWGIDEEWIPADEALRKVLAKKSPEGKLVYVFQTRKEDGFDVITVTTSEAADKRGFTIPQELKQPKSKK